MIHFRNYRSCVVDADGDPDFDADDMARVLESAKPVKFARLPGFYRFSLADESTLMAEYHDGSEWWVLGFLTGDQDEIGKLPTWKPKKATP